MVSCGAESDVIVTNRDAHAWAEYYDSDSATWRVLEATAADLNHEESGAVTEIPQTETQPEETQEPTEDSVTEPSNQESNPTKPSAGKDNSENSDGSSEKIQGTDTDKKPFRIPDWIRTVFRCLLFAVCIPVQGYARIHRKRILWNRGKPNAKTMERWRQTRVLAKLLKQPYPEELDNLSQKAKFSQHRILPEELRQFEDYRISLVELLTQKPWYHRLIFKWILAIA